MMALLKDQNDILNRYSISASGKAIILMELLQKEYDLK
jgi:hypothetical protein